MTRRLYMDNAATSFPKPPEVAQAMTRYATELGASPGRGAYAEARESGRLMNACRERLNRLINGENPDHVIFTLNTSDALNLGIRGMLRPGDHVITTDLDHNSILRPFNKLVADNLVEQTRLPVDARTGLVDPDDVRKAVRKNTRLVALLHGSNVTGTLQPVRDIGRICREMAVPFLVDAAQSLGHVPLDVQADHIDLLAFPGHKGLLGPLGTGGLYIRPGLEKHLNTVREGGTGSVSERDTQPDFMPDKYEPGSHNAIGIIGLSEGVNWILGQTVDKLWKHQQSLMQVMIEGLTAAADQGVHLYGPPGIANRCGVFSIRIDGYDQPAQLSDTLEQRYGILTRSGIHCAPLAHHTIGTRDRAGTTRFSFGPYTTLQDVKYACDALFELAESAAAVSA
ncbi:aminotransferase class V-fold PLP-dependent enzyme [Mucisphaera calidilacus]|uniref:cysteine desulfurase n=1 Tax=Mucisphaera calidilacus TaxID=2527982 RepID=A0A518BXI6_9BACT|nr:aminotransferase class V-fold PLP-dependent enzyme [Mucisphaera calidilacus]QDU71685.1 putative cysteine desulfurase [Mucisphaera calidilacus]